MTGFPWLPIGTALPGGATLGRLLDSGGAWQVCGTGEGAHVALLLRQDDAPDWWPAELAALRASVAAPPAEAEGLLCLLLPAAGRPLTLDGLAVRSSAVGREEARTLGAALQALQRRNPHAAWGSALFLNREHLVLAAGLDLDEDRRAVLVAALSGGVGDPLLPPERIASLNPRLDTATITELLAPLRAARPPAAPSPEGFVLPGQRALQTMLRERVLDVLHRPERYARLGVPLPGGVLLAGPPGCGKSFAARRLAAFLGWKLHEISVGAVGSMWLHETSRQIQAAFDGAAAEAPAIVLLEELDALGKARAGGFGPTAEEVNTLLRLVEGARHRGLLVVATTNRLDAIDPALRRRGRFDQVVVMDYPDEDAMAEMLRAMLDDRPHTPTLDIQGAARRLARRPASDAVWVIDEAARLAVVGDRDAIDDMTLARALQNLGPSGS